MEIVPFLQELHALGDVYVVAYGNHVFAEGRTRLVDARVGNKYVAFHGGLELHITKDPATRIVFGEGEGLYSKKYEYWIKLQDADGGDIIRVSLLKPAGSDDYDAENLAAYHVLKAKCEGGA